MTLSNLQVRRATVEDLAVLKPLWQQDNLPVPDLEQRFKEFQVAVNPEGKVLGAIGLQLAGPEGLIHSEVFVHPEQADELREKLWERAQVLARNHGLLRLWTPLQTPFWRANGFRQSEADLLSRLPAVFGPASLPWLYIQLKEEGQEISLEKEFALFRQTEKDETEKLYRQARVLKMIAFALSVGLFLLVIVWAFLFLRAQGRLPRP